jgi:hypothetical protein
MWKCFSNGLVAIAGMVSVPAMMTHRDVRPPADPIAENRGDPRLEALERFFAEDAPARLLGAVFLAEADRYRLDWRLLPSISLVETSGGKNARNNNLFGWNCGRAAFASLGQGISEVAFRLANSKVYKDKALDELLEAYNPNPEYARIVQSVMHRIAPAESSAE